MNKNKNITENETTDRHESVGVHCQVITFLAEGNKMFSVRQKREIAEKVQQILRETNHPELPKGEISFTLRVSGAGIWSWAEIKNNGSVTNPDINPHNEMQDADSQKHL